MKGNRTLFLLTSFLVAAIGAALGSWIYWALDFPMFSETVVLWIGAITVGLSILSVVTLIIWCLYRDYKGLGE